MYNQLGTKNFRVTHAKGEEDGTSLDIWFGHILTTIKVDQLDELITLLTKSRELFGLAKNHPYVYGGCTAVRGGDIALCSTRNPEGRTPNGNT